MEEINHRSIDAVFDCVIPFINDLNTFSLICRKSCEADGKTRKHVTVHTPYATSPSRFCHRFPFLQSLTMHGLCKLNDEVIITPWVQQITTSLYLLNSVCLKVLFLSDSDLELLARTRGKQLRVIEIRSCAGFSTLGLSHVGKYCNNLRDLCLVNNVIDENGEKWLHELGSRNTGIERLNLYAVKYDLKDLVLLAKSCSRKLVSVKIDVKYDFIDLVEFFSYAVNLEEFGGGEFSDDHKDEYNSFKFPDSLKHLVMKSIRNVKIVVPFAHLLTELDCGHSYLDRSKFCELIQSCRNLKVLRTTDGIGNQGLRDVSIYCKNLRKLYVNRGSGGRVLSHDVVIDLARQCVELECLHINLGSMTNEVMSYIGMHMKKLNDFSMRLVKTGSTKCLPLDNGVCSLLIGCDKLEKLDIYFAMGGGLTDKGLGFIGKYGCNLRYLSLGNVGGSDAGLMELSNGCPKLRNLVTRGCDFSKEALDIFRCNVMSLRYFCVEGKPRPCRKASFGRNLSEY